MLKIEILGPGCANCRRLDQLTHKVLEELTVKADISKVTDPLKFADYDVMATPGLVINDKTVCTGRVPSVTELTEFINAALAVD